jgi:predicted permease
LLTESVVLAAIGGGAGLAVALWAARGLVALASAGETWRLSMKLDWHVIAFTLLVSIVGVVIFGLAPAVASTRVNLNGVLHGGSPTIGGSRPRRTSARVFIVVQVAFSLLLVAGSSLLVRSFWNLTHQDLGFEPAEILMARVDANESNIRLLIDTETHQAIYRRVNEIPGVRSAAVGDELFGWIPLGAGGVALPDRTIPPTAGVRTLTASSLYVETLGIPVLRGRAIREADRKTAPRVAVVNQTAARLMFGSADPLGKVFSLGEQFLQESQLEVVGVVADFRVDSSRGAFEPIVLIPMLQIPPASLSPNVMVRASAPPAQVLKQIQDALRDISPALRVERIKRLEDLVLLSVRRERLLAWLSGGFGLLALVLAAVGLYGVVAYSTQLRAQEIGIRLTLAATPLQVLAGLLKETLLLLGTGLLIGISLTFAVTTPLESLLFGLTPYDPSTLALGVTVLAAVGLVAAYLPAHRATRLDPTAVLRRG